MTNDKYLVGAYERLSKEDDKKDDSSSIESQKMIIESFAKFNQLEIIKHYSDDGFTGSNFNRPAFEALKNDIEKGLINCVVVKDLSRLGRELYETGGYIEEYFLSKQVRFIAINDGYDSNVGDAMLGIRLSVNDLYLRDTSKKIRSSFDAKRKKGDYIGSFAKYGYQKDPQNPKHLIIDPITSKIVKQMFEWVVQGLGTSTIAHRLTKAKIPIPSIYKKEDRANHQNKLNDGFGIWRPQTVKNIVSDQMYLGHMVQSRWKKLSYNSKKLIELPPSSWIIVKNTHEPIIDQALFDAAQQELSKYHKYCSRHEKRFLFQGLLKCKECGHNLSISTRKTKKNIQHWTQCNYYSKYSKYGMCTSHRLNYDLLEKDLLKFLKFAGKKFLEDYNYECLLNESMQICQKKLVELKNSLNKVQREILKKESMLTHLYEDRLDEIISVKQYILMSKKIENELSDLAGKKNELTKAMFLYKNDCLDNDIEKYKQLIKDFMSFKFPTNELMFQLIDKIEIDKDKNIEVFFKVNISKYIDMDCIEVTR